MPPSAPIACVAIGNAVWSADCAAAGMPGVDGTFAAIPEGVAAGGLATPESGAAGFGGVLAATGTGTGTRMMRTGGGP